MEFDVGLYPEGGSKSLHTQNPQDEHFRTILEKAHLTTKVTIKEVHHGKLRWERRTFEGSLLLFNFEFKSKVFSHRYRKASVTLEFCDPGGKMSHYPAVFKSEDKSSGPENAVTWTIEENTGQKDGIPSFLQAAVLLRRTTTKAFRVQLRVRSEVDWKSNAQRVLSLKSDVDKIIDPILLTPGTAQEGVDNSYITGIKEEDLLALQNLPMANYYKIIHPAEEDGWSVYYRWAK
ncbi:hypothetical protein GGS24DRAFT_504561 [Hypoxylon argillaceum]|nr:hypothetical protein GGS24DRAFT_504561 [Hypoxylon argillaceum]